MMAEKITSKELESHKNDFVIIDVRETDELAGGKIESAENIPLGLMIRKAKHGEFANLQGKKICTYCASGYRGNIAAEELNKVGFNAVNLEGGFPSWTHIHDSEVQLAELIPDVIPEEKKTLEPPMQSQDDEKDDEYEQEDEFEEKSK